MLREEKHPHPILSFSRQADPLLSHLFYEEIVRDLRKDPNAVSGLSFRILSGPVVKMFHDRQRVTHQLMALSSLDVNDSSDPAIIMFKGCVIKANALYGFQSFCHDHTSRKKKTLRVTKPEAPLLLNNSFNPVHSLLPYRP